MSGKIVLGAALILVGLPPLCALVDAVAFHAANRNNGAIVTSGERREYLVYVPRSYDRSVPTPLVLSFHGAGGWPAQQMRLTGWNGLAERERFIVVYPAGSGVPRVWHDGEGRARDVTFIAELIAKLEATYRIDPARIYVSGFSNGGNMAFLLSCALSDRIAAAGMVGAALSLPWSQCADRAAVPMVAFHGTADPFALYGGGRSPIAPEVVQFQSVPMWAARRARRNGCRGGAVDARVAADVVIRTYGDCTAGADVVLYTVRGGGHQWFGGEPLPAWFVGPQNNEVEATERMWAFFRDHPRRR